MERITKDFLKRKFYNDSYEDGIRVFNSGCLNDVTLAQAEEGIRINGVVEAKEGRVTNIYRPHLDLIDDELDNIWCSCFAGRVFRSCEHLVAMMLNVARKWDVFGPEINKPRLNRKTKEFVEYFNSRNMAKATNTKKNNVSYELVPIFCIDLREIQKCWIEFKVLTPKAYKIRNIPDLINSYILGTPYDVSSKTKLYFKDSFKDTFSKNLIDLIVERYKDETEAQSWYYDDYYLVDSFTKTKKFPLTKMRMEKFFKIMQDEQFEIKFSNFTSTNNSVGRLIKQRPDLNVELSKKENGVELVFNNNDETKVYYSLENSFEYIYFDGEIYNVDKEFADNIMPISNYQVRSRSNVMVLPESQIENIFKSILPKLEKIAEVQNCEELETKYLKPALDAKLYFDKFNSGISVKINFCYDDIIINPLSSEPINWNLKDKILIRDEEKESYIVEMFKSSGFKKMSDVIVLVDEQSVYDFLTNVLPELQTVTKVYYSEDFKKVKLLSSPTLKAKVRLNKEGSLLEMDLDYGDIEPKELKDVLASYKVKKKYHRLKSGSFVSLESDEIKEMAEMFEQLNLTSQQIAKDKIQIPKYRAMYLDALAKEENSFALTRGKEVKKLVQDICESSDLDYEIPNNITGELRDYQKVGFSWLKSLANHRLGGILADDMGLGKTLQVITFILSEKDDSSLPSLVIAPSSLLYNWEDEVKKFAPDLRVKIVAGTVSERKEIIKDIDGADIVVTSYGMAKKDVEMYETISFKYCFIDEAQHIKNPNTLNAKSVKKIKAHAYFALTGTPIENSLTELWSIFDFLMPAYLSSHKKFSSRFEIPIIKQKDAKAMENLKKHIKPFILRRLKKDVLKELPPKNEIRTSSEMTKEQKKVYMAYMSEAKESIAKEIKEKGFEKSQIKILSILTRLRQICCHPSTFIENYNGGSGKLEMFNELITDLRDSGHRILVFSQFTSMLAIIKTELEKNGQTYFSLDGATPSKDRMRMVNAFNKGEQDIFLLSLKAGGTGLNLTGADVVIHFDPWWNPAVEDQASDRAYRIGQENSVSVYKLITKNSIEEKIFDLQARKKELIDSVINPGENFLVKMTQEEIKGLFEID